MCRTSSGHLFVARLMMVVGAMVFSSQYSYASGFVSAATITNIYAVGVTNMKQQDGFVIVNTNPAPAGQPACASNGRLAINAATDSGKAMIATVLAAKAAGQAVTIQGWGVCDISSDSESIYWIGAQ